MGKIDKLVFVDVETSGGGPLRDRIIEIGMVVVENGRKTQTFTSLINPNCQVSKDILGMTGIKPQDLETAPEFGIIASKIKELLSGGVFVAHNARFDFGFLKQEFARLEERVWWPQLCTVRLSRSLFPQERRHGLDAIIQRFNLSCDDRHRALPDALATADFYLKLGEIIPEEKLATTVTAILKQPALPPALASAELERLPSEPGVYLFYGPDNILLYVGKSINLRDRVWGHFYQDLENEKELALKNQVQRIETLVTQGELEALLLESRLVKQRQPIYNRRLRSTTEFWTLSLDTRQPAHQVVLKKETALSETDIPMCLGVYRRRPQAIAALNDLAAKYQLCRHQLGLEKRPGACFGYHLDTCAGVCCGKERPEKFNLRLLAALAEIGLPSWPYEGAIGIRENNSFEPVANIHWFNQWCYRGSGTQADLAATEAGNFDFDLFHILKRFLKDYSPSQLVTVDLTNQSVPGREAGDKYLPG